MKKFTTIVVFFLITGSYAHTQDYKSFYPLGQKDRVKIKRLINELPALKDSARIDCLNALSYAYLGFVNDTATSFARQALIESDKINYVRGQALAYRNLGQNECMLITDLPSAEKYFSMSLALYIKLGDQRQIAWAWGALGVAKWILSNFPEARYSFDKAEKLFKKIRDTINLIGTYEFMKRSEFESGDYAKSLEYNFKQTDLTGSVDYNFLGRLYEAVGDVETADRYWNEMPVPQGDALNWFRLAKGNRLAGKLQYDSALYYYQLFSEYAQKAGPGPTIKLYRSLGALHLAQQHYDTALDFLNRALILSSKANDRNQVMIVLLLLSKTNNEKGNYPKALENASALLQIASSTGAKQNVRDAHFLLYRVFDHMQVTDSALAHLKKYIAIKDTIDLNLSAQKLAFYLTKSEREKTQADLRYLKEKSRLQLQQLKQTAQQKAFLIAGIAGLLIISVLIFRNILLKRRAEKNRFKLAEKELTLQKLQSERKQAELQQTASDLEMQALRAQMNPHFIFNCLNAINGFILANESEAASDYLTKFSRLIRLVLNNSQKKLISLEDELETLGLYLYMESLRFTFYYHIKYDNGLDTLSVFIPPLLLQPFAENAIWHGLMHKEGHRELLIDLRLENETLYANVTDNGVGRSKAAKLKSKSAEKNKSMGLQITQNRMALLNGDLNGECCFEINDLADEWGNATGTQVSLKMKINDSQHLV